MRPNAASPSSSVKDDSARNEMPETPTPTPSLNRVSDLRCEFATVTVSCCWLVHVLCVLTEQLVVDAVENRF